LFGAAKIGKSFLVNMLDGCTDVVDCTQMGTVVTTIEQIDLLIEYLELRLQEILKEPAVDKLLIFDNI
jgi:hypothetical protein